MMPLFNNTPLLMVVAFLLLTLSIALYFTRRATTFREYAVGDKQFPTATLVATVLATVFGGGGLVRSVEQIHNLGLYWIIFFLNGPFSYWTISWLALRMAPFMHNLSMSETIGRVYGKYPRIITSLTYIGFSVVVISIQIQVMSRAISMCIDIDSVDNKMITIFATLVLIFYATIGGIRIVTFTDMVQVGIFCIIIPILSWWIYMQTGKSIPEMISFLQTQEKFQLNNLFHFDMKLMATVALYLSAIISGTTPPIIQRVYMSTDHFQASRIFLNAGIASLMMNFFIILIGLFIFVAAPELPVTAVWPYIIAHIPPIFKGFWAISLLTLSMSTADSFLNTSSVMFSNDMVHSMMARKDIPYRNQLGLAQLTALLIGILAMVLTFYYTDLIELVMLAFDCFIPVATGPFILAILGFRATSRTALIGMATGVLTILTWNQWVESTTGINGAFIAMVVNGLAMMAAHYLLPQPKGKIRDGSTPNNQLKSIQ